MRTELPWVIALFFVVSGARPVAAQPCDDDNECTVNTMCSDGFCSGDPVLDGSCDDGNDCTVNDRCAFNEVAMLSYCEGDPVENGTVCNQGCGRCSMGYCRSDPSQEGRSCTIEFGLCILGGQCLFGICLADFRAECPTEDPCRLELCNPLTGQCEDTGLSPCGECQSCRPLPSEPPGFECALLEEGASCDDGNVCTGAGICEFGSCYPGPPIHETPVETPEPTSTPAPTEPPSTPIPTSPAATPTSTSPTVLPTSTPRTTATTPVTPVSTPTGSPGQALDFGDAPDGIGDPAIPTPGYPTLLANDGARHILVEGFFLGDSVDSEFDGQPNVTATGDDEDSEPTDEDGIEFLTVVRIAETVQIRVTAAQLGRLDAFVDFDRNGSWADAGDQVFSSTEVQAGPNELDFSVPSNAAAGLSFARFRYSSAGGLSADGLAEDGEVEDYRIEIIDASAIASRLAEAIDAAADMIPLADTTGFPSDGTVRIGEERIRYSSIVSTGALAAGARDPRGADSGGTLVVAERGAGGTTAQGHEAGALVVLVPSVPACVGDCGDDGEVTVDELIAGVNIALGEASVDLCPAFDADGSDDVTVDEILTAVNNALNGCA